MQRFRQHVRQWTTWAWCALPLLAGCQDMPAPAQQGRLLAEHYQCTACHRAPGVAGPQGGVGPTLARFGRRSYIAGRVPHTPEALVRWLMDPPALVPGTAMPRLGIPEADARALAAWLAEQR